MTSARYLSVLGFQRDGNLLYDWRARQSSQDRKFRPIKETSDLVKKGRSRKVSSLSAPRADCGRSLDAARLIAGNDPYVSVREKDKGLRALTEGRQPCL